MIFNTLVVLGAVQLFANDGQLRLKTVDGDTNAPITCRMTLRNSAQQFRKPRGVVSLGPDFVVPGELLLRLPRGTYYFELQRGLEYLGYQGENYFIIDRFADGVQEVPLRRFIHMAQLGWWSGDLDVRRPAAQMAVLMDSEDLHLAQMIAPRSETAVSEGFETPLQMPTPDRAFHLGGREIRHAATVHHVFDVSARPVADGDDRWPLSLDASAVALLAANDSQQTAQVWIDVARPDAWDLPILAGTGTLDSLQMAHPGLLSPQTEDSLGRRPRDEFAYPGRVGSARWNCDIYYRLLDCGFRIPPSAGSGSGPFENPVGANRAYVKLEDSFSRDAWFEGLRAGRVFITSGPMLITSVRGQPPGAVFQADAGETLDLQIAMTLSTREPIDYVEIVRNGVVEHSIRIRDLYDAGGRLPPVRFEQSGWFLVRAAADSGDNYRFAMTGPYYVQIGQERRVSRAAARFFLDWINDYARRIQIEDPVGRAAALERPRAARDYFRRLLEAANTD